MIVRVYEKPNCTACVNTKRKLNTAGIVFETADITEPGNMAAAKELGYMAAPVVVAGDVHWSGFRPDKIDELVKRLETEGN